MEDNATAGEINLALKMKEMLATFITAQEDSHRISHTARVSPSTNMLESLTEL
tara:strand:- start:404 stop:562 length:159 start_codon:yes stop_codon:yes gene_type:complete